MSCILSSSASIYPDIRDIEQPPATGIRYHHANRKVELGSRRTVVLLKHGLLEAVECLSDEIFLLARVRGAGICGVFEDSETARLYILKHALPSVHTQPAGESPLEA